MNKKFFFILGISLFTPHITKAASEDDILSFYPELIIALLGVVSAISLLKTSLSTEGEIKRMFYSFTVGTFLYTTTWLILVGKEISNNHNPLFFEVLFEIFSILSIAVISYSIYTSSKIFQNFKYQINSLEEDKDELIKKQKELDEINSLLDRMNIETKEKDKEVQSVLNDFYELMPQVKKLIKKRDLNEKCDILRTKIDKINANTTKEI
mgnify:CR=1 FL=1